MLVFEALVQEWRKLGGDAFRAQHDCPYLLRLNPEQEGVPGDTAAFATMAVDELRRDDEARLRRLEMPVFPVRKLAKNAFGMMITVGRARNNDVVLDSSTVSKFHAFLAKSGDGWSLRDAQSTNKTWVEDKQLDPAAAVPLPDEALVIFGRVVCKFLLADSLAQLVELEAKR